MGTNGAGKSTLLDAICYGLFGTPFRKINIPTMVNSINKSDMVVEIDFTLNSSHYMVRRGIKPNLFEIWHNGKLIDQTGAREYQNLLENQILHLNKKTFTQVAILGNANYVPFMQLVAADRRQVIEDILDIQIFSVMNKLLKARQKTVADKLVTNKHDYDVTETESKLKQAHIAQLQRNKQAEIDENEAKKDEATNAINENTAKVNANNAEIESLRKNLANKSEISKKLLHANSNYEKIEHKHSKVQSELDFWQNTQNCPTCEQVIADEKKQSKRDELNGNLVAFKDALKKLDEIRTQFNERMNEMQVLESKISALNQENARRLAETKVHVSLLFQYEKKGLELERDSADLEAEKESLQELEVRLAKLTQERDELNKDVVHLEITESLLKDTGIKTRTIRRYLPIINKLMNKHLANMDFFVNFELDESFKETIKSRYRDEFSYENFSEGEKQRIDMAQMLTWREIAKMKNSAATNLLILDEIFDSSLDAEGVEFLLHILHGLEKCNIFVISHKGDLLLDKFHQVIKFSKVGNYSRIS